MKASISTFSAATAPLTAISAVAGNDTNAVGTTKVLLISMSFEIGSYLIGGAAVVVP